MTSDCLDDKSISLGNKLNLEDVIEIFPNIEPLLIRKWYYAFCTYFDLTGNNVIEWRDFQTLINAIGLMRGEDSEVHNAARRSLTDVWNSMTKALHKDITDKGLNELSASGAMLSDYDKHIGPQCFERLLNEPMISLVDWVGMWADSLTAEKEPAWQNVYLNYMFRLLDASGDELVDLAEYIDVLGTFSVPRDIAIACFDKFATNSAGGPCNSINYNTFTNLWQQYFRSDDINDVGNHLLGTI